MRVANIEVKVERETWALWTAKIWGRYCQHNLYVTGEKCFGQPKYCGDIIYLLKYLKQNIDVAVERCCGQPKYGGDIRWKIVKGNFCAETFFLLQYKFVHIFLHIIIHDKSECAFVCSVHFFFNINLSKIVFAMIGTRMGLFVLLQDPRKEGHLCQSFP